MEFILLEKCIFLISPSVIVPINFFDLTTNTIFFFIFLKIFFTSDNFFSDDRQFLKYLKMISYYKFFVKIFISSGKLSIGLQ